MNKRVMAKMGKSMKAVELAVAREDCWRKIAIALSDELSKRAIACLQHLSTRLNKKSYGN
jgi:hypothetical protein